MKIETGKTLSNRSAHISLESSKGPKDISEIDRLDRMLFVFPFPSLPYPTLDPRSCLIHKVIVLALPKLPLLGWECGLG